MKKITLLLLTIITTTITAQNLVINGSAEMPILTNGWTQISGDWQQRMGTPAPQDGSAYFFAGTSSYAELFQEVDVSSNSANIDLGTQKYSFSCFLRSYGQSNPDNSKVIVTYLDISNTVLDTYDTGYSSDAENWIYFADVRIVPIGTRTIKITLISSRNSGSHNDGYIDNVILKVGDTLPPSNDFCNSPINIPVTVSNPVTVVTNTTFATSTVSSSSCENSSQTWLDQWYTFTMPVNGNIYITQTSFRDSFTLYDSCDGVEIACFNNSGLFYSLVSGTTYTLKFSNRNVFAGVKSFNIQAFETATNNNCSTPEIIPINTNTVTTVNTNTLAATASNVLSSCENTSQIWLDQWYTFTMPFSGNIHITQTSFRDSFTLYNFCGDAEIACFNNNGNFYSLTNGATYTLKFSNRNVFASTNSFNIQAFEIAANNNCSTPETIPINTNTAINVNTNTLTATASTAMSSCDDPNLIYLDQYYTFTMPVNGNVYISGVNIFDRFTLYDACNGNELYCFSDDGFFYSLTQNTIYTLRYAKRDIYASVDSFSIQAFETALNSNCASAIPITVQTNTFTQVDTNTQQSSISTDISSCQNSTEAWLDLWYTFTMPVNGNVRITSMQNTTEYATIYDACGIAANEIACFNGDGYAYSLIAGTTYTIKYSQIEFWSGVNSFRIQAFETTLNSDCANAENISINTNTFTIVNTNTPSSTLSPNLSSCQNTNENWLDQWFSFTMPIDGNVQITHLSNISEYLSLYDACGGNELGCFTNNGTINSLASGTTYYIKYAQTEFWSDQNNFRIKAIETASNDLCLDAINLNVGIYDEFSQNKTFFGASPSQAPLPPSSTCAVSSGNNDTWFTVQVPDSGKLTIETKQSLGSTLTNTAMQVFENSCGSFVEIGCDDNSGNGNFSKVEITGRVPLETL